MSGRLYPVGGRSHVLTKWSMVIGRAPGCDIQLAHASVSNRHCALVFDGNAWVAVDLGSRNGTLVNDVPATPRRLVKPGDTLTVARKFRFVIEYEPAVEQLRFGDGIGNVEDVLSAGPPSGSLGPATKRSEPNDKDAWSRFEK